MSHYSPPPPLPFGVTCSTCRDHAEPLLCGAGRSTVYGAEAAECQRFEVAATAFDAQIRGWTEVGVPSPPPPPSIPPSSPPDGLNATSGSTPSVLPASSTGGGPVTTVDVYPGCREALEVFFCAEHPVHQQGGVSSPCSDYRRPYQAGSGRCLAFCPAIGRSCPTAALAHCESTCRAVAYPTPFCDVLEITGLDRGSWDEDVLDIMNLYRLEAEQEVPLLRDRRPYYRSIPARRPPGSARKTKLDYYLYATRRNGFTEWMLDTNEFDADGASAFVADSTLAPYHINSEWTVYRRQSSEWSTATLQITCLSAQGGVSAASARWGNAATASWLGLAGLAAWHVTARRR